MIPGIRESLRNYVLYSAHDKDVPLNSVFMAESEQLVAMQDGGEEEDSMFHQYEEEIRNER